MPNAPPQVAPRIGPDRTARPYRSPGPVDRRLHDAARGEGPLLAFLAIFWLVSVGRVVGAIAVHETFGGEATLALVAALAMPWATWRGYQRRRADAAAAVSGRDAPPVD
jgi:hypothetical protein